MLGVQAGGVPGLQGACLHMLQTAGRGAGREQVGEQVREQVGEQVREQVGSRLALQAWRLGLARGSTAAVGWRGPGRRV